MSTVSRFQSKNKNDRQTNRNTMKILDADSNLVVVVVTVKQSATVQQTASQEKNTEVETRE